MTALAVAELVAFANALEQPGGALFCFGLSEVDVMLARLDDAIDAGAILLRGNVFLAANDGPSRALVSRFADLLLADLGVRT